MWQCVQPDEVDGAHSACDQSRRRFVVIIVVASAACVIVLCSDISILIPASTTIQVLRPIAMTTRELYVKVLFTSCWGRDTRYLMRILEEDGRSLFWRKIARREFSHRFNPPRETDASRGCFGSICSLNAIKAFRYSFRIDVSDSSTWQIMILNANLGDN